MLARNRQEDHERMDEMLREHGPEAFAQHWLEAQGFPEHAARLRAGGNIMEDVA